jgi:putative DNA primase/helicase
VYLELDDDWNIGVRCGSASGIMVIDVDGSEGLAELAQLEAEHEPLRPTFMYRSGRDDVSTHRVFAIPEGRVVRTGKLAPHIDVKAEARYARLPPSLHRTGRRSGAR